MKTINTTEATGAALDWLVAKIEGCKVDALPGLSVQSSASWEMYSSSWSQGGPIIEREGIEMLCNLSAEEAARFTAPGVTADWRAAKRPINRNVRSFGPTPLIAAMRCYVQSKLGDTVEVPEELA